MVAKAAESRERVLRVARWCRVSTAEQSRESEGRAGLQRQYDQTDQIIASRGYNLVESFELIGVGGNDVVLSKQFSQLTRLIEGHKIDAVVVSEVSRLARVDRLESLAALGVFAKHNCLIITQDQSIDFNSPEGWLTGGLFTILAGHEKMEMHRKIEAAKENLRRSGNARPALRLCRVAFVTLARSKNFITIPPLLVLFKK